MYECNACNDTGWAPGETGRHPEVPCPLCPASERAAEQYYS